MPPRSSALVHSASLLLVILTLAMPARAGGILPFTLPRVARTPALSITPTSRPATPSQAKASDGQWRETGLLQVSHTLGVYDPARDELLSVGGSRQRNWALNLSGSPAWTPLPPMSPEVPLLEERLSTLDPATGEVYVLSWGTSGIEVHVLDPRTGNVTAIVAAGPAPSLLYPRPLFDAPDHRLLLFGGADAKGPTSEVWALDLLPTPTWSHWAPSGSPPPPHGLAAAAATVDPVRRRMLVFPQTPQESDSIWALSLDGPPVWSVHTTNGLATNPNPNPMVYDRANDRIWTMDGQAEPWCLSLTTLQWSHVSTSAPSPTPRWNAGVAIDAARHRLLVFGGRTPSGDDTHSDTWALALDGTPAWTQLVPDAVRPPIRGGAGDGFDASRNRLVVFGGSDELGGFRNDTWALDLAPEPQWSAITTGGGPPPARFWQASAWDAGRDQLVIFGGYAGDAIHPLGDLWTLSFAVGTPTWSAVTPAGPAPSARMSANLVYDSARDRMLLLFGDDGLSVLQDVWELRLSPAPAWRRLSPSGVAPQARAGAMCVYDPVGDRVLAFGGSSNFDFFSDLWALELGTGDGTWREIPTSQGPSRRNSALLELDAVRNRVLLFGGFGFSARDSTIITYLNDTWELDLDGTPAWRVLSPEGSPPPPRDRANGTYDPGHDRLILTCGGILGSNDTWMLDFGGTPTPVLLALANLDVTADRVRLEWAGATAGTEFTGYRREPATDWRAIASLLPDGRDVITLVDRDVNPGASYEYRLGVATANGETFVGDTQVNVPRRELSLAAKSLNGGVSFTVELPENAPAALEMFDLSGRRVWRRNLGSLGAGAHELRIEPGALAPALYFARLRQGNASRLARIAVVR